jgi:plastocyanin
MKRAAIAFAALLCSAAVTRAADLNIIVHSAKGPVADAVVTVDAADVKALPPRFSQPLSVTQHNLQFEPFVLLAPVGAEVSFPNQDTVRHHVYSFSPTKIFELKLYGREQARTVKFDKAGSVALGCNIHDQMVAFIKVVDTPFAVKTGPDGHAVIHGLPAGAATVHVWHPYMKAPGNEQKLSLSLPATGAVTKDVTADLRTPTMRMSGY